MTSIIEEFELLLEYICFDNRVFWKSNSPEISQLMANMQEASCQSQFGHPCIGRIADRPSLCELTPQTLLGQVEHVVLDGALPRVVGARPRPQRKAPQQRCTRCFPSP